ncbi:hypothetical protein EV178_000473 [Coemansia sp. RSA 1646]|nr:hypothetical protein EV178_000473 [Coemansia sp. RSA 1646]KAJ2093720.1 hypothetical protein IW138_000115 [Coemansia sp. RSA 986]
MAMPFVAPLNYVRAKENRPHRFAYDYGSVDPGMFAPTPERSRPKRAPKRSIAYTIPLPESSSIGSTHSDGHVLGVNALALSLDSVAHNTGAEDTPTGGLLFSGGRDGVVKAWDLNLPLRRPRKGTENDDSTPASEWAIDRHKTRSSSPKTSLRASHTLHSDWVNDIVLVNGSRTIVSASSDLTVRAWSPLGSNTRPSTVGSHMDYVKTLAYSDHRHMVISGGLDRKIKLWDIGEGRPSDSPICSLQEFGDASVSSSVYTLACNPQGTLVVSGSPEKFIRIWDTRAAKQLTSLSGHTDHIRAVLLSADSEYVLSGSSDTTVKLWSMRMRRCLSTYSHHTNSVWSLHSTHPRFHTFYSASRDGLVAKTIGAGMHSEEGPPTRRASLAPAPWSTVTTTAIAAAAAKTALVSSTHYEATPPVVDDTLASAGVVCVAVAKESHGVVKLVAADDAYIWTATKGPALNRWMDINIRKPYVLRQHGTSTNGQQSGASAPAAQTPQPIPGRGASALSAINGSSGSAAAGTTYAGTQSQSPEVVTDTEFSTSDSDEFGSVTRNSLIEPLQAFIFDDSSAAQTNGNHVDAAQNHQHNVYCDSGKTNSVGLHRRNHTVNHSAPYAFALRNTASPVLKAMQAEQARRSMIRESDGEDLFEDARMSPGTSTDSARSSLHHLRHVRSRSIEYGQDKAHGSISALLATERTSAQSRSVLGKSSVPVLNCATSEKCGGGEDDSASIMDSPLPSSSLINAKATTSPATAAASVSVSGVGGGMHTSPLHYSLYNKGQTKGISSAQRNLDEEHEVVPVRSKPDETIHGKHGLHRHKILPNKRQVLAQDTQGRVSLWDIMLCRRIYEFPATEEDTHDSKKFNGIFGKDFDRIESLLSLHPEAVNSWCRVDTRIGALTVRFDESQVWSAEVHVDEIDGITPETIRAMGDHERVNIGQWMLKRLFLNYARARVKRGPISAQVATQLNYWAAQIPTAEVVSAKAAAPHSYQSPYSASESPKPMTPGVTRAATTHTAAVRLPALTVGSNPSTLNAPGIHPSNSHLGISEKQLQQQKQRFPAIASQLVSSAKEIGIGDLVALPVSKSTEAPYSAKSANGIPPLHGLPKQEQNSMAGSGRKDSGGSSSTSSSADHETYTTNENTKTKPAVGPPTQPRHQHNVSIDTAPGTPQGATSQQQLLGRGEDGESASSNGSTGKFMNRLRSIRVRKQKSIGSTQGSPGSGSNKPTLAGTISGNNSNPVLPNTNKSNSTPDTRVNGPNTVNINGSQDSSGNTFAKPERDGFAEWAGPRFPTDTERTLALLQCTPAPWEQLYSPIVCPRLPLPRNVVVQICQEHVDAPEPYSIYRNTIDYIVGSPEQQQNSMSIFRITDDPLLSFEMSIPAWLTDFLLFNKLPASYQEPAKVSFVLSPLQGSTLPPFPNPTARLVANGMLRARKLAIYVVDKIGLPLMQQPALNYVNAVDACARAYKNNPALSHLSETSSNTFIDLFTRAGEVLSEEEQAALDDVIFWRNSTINKGSGNSGPEYVGRPELYLDLFSKDVKVKPRQTLATIKANVWKASGDIQVYYEWASFVKRRILVAQGLVTKE